MSRLSDSHHFRKTIAGVCMIGAPLFLLIAMVIHPERKSDVGDQLAVVAGEMDAWYASHLIAAIALVLAVPAVLGLMHMLREREVAFGHVGGALALLGLMATTGVVAIEGFVGWQAAASPSPEMTALFERITETTGIVVPFFVMSLGFAAGMLFLASGLYRARAVQSWTAAMLAVGAVVLAVGNAAASDLFAILGGAVLFVGFVQVGRMVLAESDEEWEHTPEYRGSRPLAGTR
ncbi:MAG TPA: hypothetical protein VD790_12200 [Thermoleophilaceae bacterium]|nr:hypothetical protein [Thermoleophilaceae bacterium]